MVDISPDPVREGVLYREMLIDLTKGEDPQRLQSMTGVEFRKLVEQAGPNVATRPSDKEWSVLECLAHVTHAEVVYSGRYRWTLAHEEPEMIGYDQDLWIDRLRANDDPELLLNVFNALRSFNIALWRATPQSEHSRAGLHKERGPETYGESFTLIAGHDLFHLAQARRALELL